MNQNRSRWQSHHIQRQYINTYRRSHHFQTVVEQRPQHERRKIYVHQHKKFLPDYSTGLPGGNNGVVRPGRCGAQSAVLGPEGREMKFSKKY